jgi:hypothetical protein
MYREITSKKIQGIYVEFFFELQTNFIKAQEVLKRPQSTTTYNTKNTA